MKIIVSKTPKSNTPVDWDIIIPKIGTTTTIAIPWADLLFLKYCELPIMSRIDKRTSNGEIIKITNNQVRFGKIAWPK